MPDYRSRSPRPELPHVAFISVGSNLGDKLAHCRYGIAALTDAGPARLLACSPFYRTEPVDFTDQEWFVNAVIQVATDLSPDALLIELQRIQRLAGRHSGGVRYGPRTLDLDILLFDDLVSTGEHLTIPHPRMHKRRFVLGPICDIDPAHRHPTLGCTMAELLKRLPPDGQEIAPVE